MGSEKATEKEELTPPFFCFAVRLLAPVQLFVLSFRPTANHPVPAHPLPPVLCPREALPGRGRSLSLVHTQAHACKKVDLRLCCGRRSAKRSGASSPHSDASSPFVAELAFRDAVDRNSSLQHAANAPPLALVRVLDKPIRKPSSDTGMAWAWQATIGIFPRGSCQGN